MKTDLNARLAQFPAMQWSLRDLLYRAPANPIVRQAADGRVDVPRNGTLHAVYENAIYRLQARQQEKNDKATPQQAAVNPQSAGTQPPSPAAMEENAEPVANQPVPDAQAMALAARMDTLDEDPQTDQYPVAAPATARGRAHRHAAGGV